jgi:hypothetical protein
MRERNCDKGMIDNRMVKDSHKEGISRVLQRGHERRETVGHNGKLGLKNHVKPHWRDSDDSLTPRKA